MSMVSWSLALRGKRESFWNPSTLSNSTPSKPLCLQTSRRSISKTCAFTDRSTVPESWYCQERPGAGFHHGVGVEPGEAGDLEPGENDEAGVIVSGWDEQALDQEAVELINVATKPALRRRKKLCLIGQRAYVPPCQYE